MDRRDDFNAWQESEPSEASEDLRAPRRRRPPAGGANAPTSGVPADPLRDALRGTRSGELPRVTRSGEYPRVPEQSRPPRQSAFDPLRDPLPLDYPPPTEPSAALRDATSAVDATALRASIKQTDGLYRSQKPIFAALYGLIAAVGELFMIRPFLTGAFKLAAGPALAPLLAMIAFPLLALGLYGVSTGAATAVQFQGPRVWLRTPLVYLPIALLLLIAAGAAA